LAKFSSKDWVPSCHLTYSIKALHETPSPLIHNQSEHHPLASSIRSSIYVDSSTPVP